MLSGVRQTSVPQQTSEASQPAQVDQPAQANQPAATKPAEATPPAAGAGPKGTSTFETAPATTPPATTQPAATETPTPATPPKWSFSATINADRAKATREALQKYATGDEKAGQRLTPAIVDALANGVGTPKNASILGQEGVLGRRQAMDAARALAGMPQPTFDRINSLLDQAGQGADGKVAEGANPDTERALILKAVAARSASLGDAGTQEQAMGELEWFAGAIRGQGRDSVIQQTSVVDVDDQANTSTANPLDPTVTNDQKKDNDGYAQRFTTSCAPAVAAMLRGETDPVFAMMLNADGLQNADPGAGASGLERKVLEADRFFTNTDAAVQLTPEQMAAFQKDGTLPPGVEHMNGQAVSRVGQQARKVMDERLDEAVDCGKITKDEAAALRKDAVGGTLTEAEQKDRDKALAVVRDGNGNHPTDFELKAMQGDRPQEKFMLMAHALRDLASGVTHTDYWNFPAGDAMAKPMLDGVDRLLTSGVDIPIRLANPGQDGGHFMMMTDVRNQEGQREFLVSDPWSGRTAWLTESDLSNPKSDWPRREFNVFYKQVSDIFAPIDFVNPDSQ